VLDNLRDSKYMLTAMLFLLLPNVLDLLTRASELLTEGLLTIVLFVKYIRARLEKKELNPSTTECNLPGMP